MSLLKRRSFLKKAALAGAAAPLVAASSFPSPAIAQNKLRWSMTTTWPKNFPGLGTAANRLAQEITRASGGRMEIRVYGAGEIVPAFDAIDAVANGTVEMGHGAPYYWKGKSPAAQFLASIPFGLTAQEQNAWLDFGGGQELADEIYADMGCKFFAAGNTGVQMAGWYNREINSTADFQGLKIRLPGLGGEVLKALGATVVNLPGGELLPAIQSGTIDAIEWVGPYNDVSFGLHRAAKYYYAPGWHEPATILDSFINLKAWQALPTDLQAIVENATRAANQYVLNELTARNAEFLRILQEKHKIVPRRLSPEILKNIRKEAEKVVQALAAQDPASKRLYDSVSAFQAVSAPWSALSESAYLTAREA